VIENRNVLDVVKQLDAVGIVVRGGDLASLPVLKRLGISAAIRASCFAYTSEEEIDRLMTALRMPA
jgi:cysteine desulfurase / selenocysteine lyase